MMIHSFRGSFTKHQSNRFIDGDEKLLATAIVGGRREESYGNLTAYRWHSKKRGLSRREPPLYRKNEKQTKDMQSIAACASKIRRI